VKRALVLFIALLDGVAHADEPAYKLRLDADLAALAIAGLSVTAWFIDLAPAPCAPLCDPARLNALDRPFAGRYSPGWTTAGTAVAGAVIAASPALLLAFERPRHALGDTAVVAESILFANALGVLFEVGVRRPRPFLYSTAAPLGDRLDGNSSLSFYSGHTTASFAATIATWRTLGRLGVAPRWLILGMGLAGSAFVAVSRVVAGDHFPTDVTVGAGMGTAFGFLLPALHDRGLTVVPTYTADMASLSAVGRF
jgi:membrane-associated phospholipid phosphatase